MSLLPELHCETVSWDCLVVPAHIPEGCDFSSCLDFINCYRLDPLDWPPSCLWTISRTPSMYKSLSLIPA